MARGKREDKTAFMRNDKLNIDRRRRIQTSCNKTYINQRTNQRDTSDDKGVRREQY